MTNVFVIVIVWIAMAIMVINISITVPSFGTIMYITVMNDGDTVFPLCGL